MLNFTVQKVQIMTAYKYLFVLTFLVLIAGCNTSKVEKAMVEFDEAFIPVYYYTYIDDLERAEKAQTILNLKYQHLYSNFEEIATQAHEWRASFEMVAGWLEEAQFAIRENDADLALLQLDHARYELMDLRWREDIPYYLDNVYDLEATIDLVVEVSTDPMLELYEWCELEKMVEDLEEAWRAVHLANVDPRIFNFDNLAKAKEADRKFNLGLAIKTFTIAAEYADAAVVANAAYNLEVAYLDYLDIFGDFEATKTYYAYR